MAKNWGVFREGINYKHPTTALSLVVAHEIVCPRPSPSLKNQFLVILHKKNKTGRILYIYFYIYIYIYIYIYFYIYIYIYTYTYIYLEQHLAGCTEYWSAAQDTGAHY